MKKIYFAGSIRGGRDDVDMYKKIVDHLQSKGNVLTEHIGDAKTTSSGENKTDHEIYARDLDWLASADLMVAEVSSPSLGVGFEIGKAIGMNKKILCLYRTQDDRKLSAMISGCPDVTVGEYQTLEEAKTIINNFIK